MPRSNFLRNFISQHPISIGAGIGDRPVLIGYQEFVRGLTGYSNQYQLSLFQNGTLSLPWNASKIMIAQPVAVVFADGSPVYDNFFPRTQAHIISSVSDSNGLVTLSAVPYSGYTAPIRLYYAYKLGDGESISGYYRDDIVVSSEASLTKFARDVLIEDSGGYYAGTQVEAALAEIGLALRSAKYIHVQSPAASVWTINHNLNHKPSVTLVDGAYKKIEAEVAYVTDNQITASFFSGGAPIAVSGRAYLN